MSLPVASLRYFSRLRPAQSRLIALTSQLQSSTFDPRPFSPTLPRFLSSTLSQRANMKAVIVEKTGGPEVLKYTTDIPTPTPKDGEVLIKNLFAGVNYIDTYFR